MRLCAPTRKEWITGQRIVALTAAMGNLGNADDPHILDHASVYCELAGGGSALVEGQRMLPDTKGSDYRVLAVGTRATRTWTSPPRR